MYEFKYPKVAELSTEKIESSIAYLSVSLQNRLEQNKDKLSTAEIVLLEKSIDHIKSGINVSINISQIHNQQIDYSIIDKLLEDSKKLNLPLNFYVVGSSISDDKTSVPMSFSQQVIDNLVELNNYLVDNNQYGLLFMEDSSSPELAWDFDDVIRANSEIDSIVDYIREMKLSPFEAATFIHQYITSQFQYKDNPIDIVSPRSIVGVLNSDDIVCVGYAYLTKAIIDKLNMKGLECSTFTSKLTPKPNITDNKKFVEILNELNLSTEGTGHIQNLIKIDDPKYKVSGNYVTDACWDSKNESFPSGKGIGNFMFPVEDLLHLSGQRFDQPNPEVEKMFKMLGLNRPYDPYSLPVIAENINNSQPITIAQYRKCLTNVYKIMTPHFSEEEIKKRVDYIINLSSIVSYKVFTKKAIGTIAKNSHKQFEKDLQGAPEQQQPE